MKKQIIFGLAFAVVAGGGQFGNPVMAMPDQLLSAASKVTAVQDNYAVVPAVKAETEQAVVDFTNDWLAANERVAAVEDKKSNNEKLSANDKAWLEGAKHSYAERFVYHLERRVEFYKRSHNWNEDNKHDRNYSYETLPGYTKEAGYTNSYGVDELRSVAAALNDVLNTATESNMPQTQEQASALAMQLTDVVKAHQSNIANDELRSYVNEAVWFAAKQATKEMKSELPDRTKNHVVDLRKAINQK